jgi:hypothetical protein
MPQSYQSIEVRPSQGGALISAISDDTPGIQNWVDKLNVRRYLERELRREGHDYLWPNNEASLGNQPFPYGEPTDLAEDGNWGGSADKIAVRKGWSYLYVAGANEQANALNDGDPDNPIGTTLVQAVGDEIWVSPKPENIGDPRTYHLYEYAPITLIHEARRPNGQKALIVGTPTTLYRFFALDNGDVFVEGVFDPDVFASESGEWIVIADGFDPDADRWEAVCINGTSVFNNGRDPMFSYRVEQFSAKAVYELREAGIAAAGTIGEFFGVLHLADISEIQSDKLLELFDPIGIRRSGAMTAAQTGTTVTTTRDFFTADDVGRTIVWDESGTPVDILVLVDGSTVTVGGSQEVTPQRFKLRTKAAQGGSTFSGSISASQALGSPNVVSSAPVFSAPMVGSKLRYVNGWASVILAFTDASNITLTDNAPDTFTNLPFFIVTQPDNASDDFKVIAFAPLFEADMVGRNISWEDGTERRILTFIDSKNVYVDADGSIAGGLASIDNPATYAAFTDRQWLNRIGYRITWSMIDQPTRFGPVYKGRMDFGGFILKLDQPARSIEVGDSLLISGAGPNGGNLQANVVYVAAHRVLAVDQRARPGNMDESGPIKVLVEKNDAANSIVGYEDLQDDSSAIIRVLELGGFLVVYKDTAIALGRYTGEVTAPFAFQLRRISPSHSLFYRNTLVLVNNDYHIYAGRNSFYSFALADRFPREIAQLEVCKDKFFSKATLENSKWIFAANNILTKEIFFGTFPYAGDDLVVCLDYLSQPMTVSTSDLLISAAGSIKRPSAASMGSVEDWFIMGTPKGVVLLYGLVYLKSQTFDQAQKIYFRREANPYSATKASYKSRLKSGLSSFGNATAEKDIRSWVPLLSSKSAKTPMEFKLYATRNPVETPDLLVTATIDPSENLAPLFFRSHYFQDQIVVDGIDNPWELVARVFDISGVRSQSFGRRVLSA